MDCKGKVILVTGASSGIGLASAQLLAAEGARVVMAARSLERMREAAIPGAFAVQMDVTDSASVERAIAEAHAHFGRIDVVINNAGNGGSLCAWDKLPDDHLRRMFDVHVFGMERVTRAVLPIMRAQGAGHIVNIASTVGFVPMPMASAYSAAKAAVISFTESLRAELAAEGISVCVFSPPHTETDAGKAWTMKGPQTFPISFTAQELLTSLRKERRNYLAGASNRMLLLIRRFSPALALKIMRDIGMASVSPASARLLRPQDSAARGS
jgi:NAD(P)-dependent dehydrogenase (short-subunit alcohol dehydrogenase family)